MGSGSGDPFLQHSEKSHQRWGAGGGVTGGDPEPQDFVLVLSLIICVTLRKPRLSVAQPQFTNSDKEVGEWILSQGGEACGDTGASRVA